MSERKTYTVRVSYSRHVDGVMDGVATVRGLTKKVADKCRRSSSFGYEVYSDSYYGGCDREEQEWLRSEDGSGSMDIDGVTVEADTTEPNA